MLILNDTHPDIYNFIDSKRTAGNITNTNISVGISDKFMDAVKLTLIGILFFRILTSKITTSFGMAI